MKKIRLVKGFSVIAALMAVCFLVGCSSSSSSSEPAVEGDYSTTVTQELSLADGGEITTAGADGNARMGNASITVDPNTVAYYDLAGIDAASGALNIEVTYSDKDSSATFPGDYASAMPEGWVDVKIFDADGRPVVKFDPPLTLTITDDTIQASNWNIFKTQEAHAMNPCPAYVTPYGATDWGFIKDCNDTITACDLANTYVASDQQMTICEIGNADKTKMRKFRICDATPEKWTVGVVCGVVVPPTGAGN